MSRNLVGMDVDLCSAVAAQLGVSLQLVPLSIESRIPELQMGRIDILIANLAYTRTRAAQIDYSIFLLCRARGGRRTRTPTPS